MIVVDTSVLIAILLDEPEGDKFVRFIPHNPTVHLSAVSLQEAGMVMLSRRGAEGIEALVDLTTTLRIQVVPYDEIQARLAIEAFGRYGKGIDPKARLNMDDCSSYALARNLGVPLLFKGLDFSATDIDAARY